jgi:hypothetical protein
MPPEDFKAMETALDRKFSAEIRELKAAQEAVDQRRAEDEEAKRALVEKSKRQQDEQLSAILQGQVDDLEERKKTRAWVAKYVLGPLALTTAGLGGVGGYIAKTTPKPADVQSQVLKSEKDLEAQITNLEQKLQTHDRIHRRMVDIQLDQQVQLFDSVTYLSDKIDKISPKAEAVDLPPSLERGAEKAAAIKQARGTQDYDPANPLADLQTP